MPKFFNTKKSVIGPDPFGLFESRDSKAKGYRINTSVISIIGVFIVAGVGFLGWVVTGEGAGMASQTTTSNQTQTINSTPTPTTATDLYIIQPLQPPRP